MTTKTLFNSWLVVKLPTHKLNHKNDPVNNVCVGLHDQYNVSSVKYGLQTILGLL